MGADAPAGTIRDVSVRDVRVPARVFYGYRPEVRAVIATLGLKGEQVQYSLLVNDEVVQRSTLVPTSDNETQEVVLDARMTQRGLVRLAVVAEPVPGELVASNNRVDTAVRVEEGAIRVLYLEGGVRPEGKYLARALGESAEINLDRRILVGGAGAPTPDQVEKFDLVVLGDLAASSLDPAVIARLAERVAAGRLNLLVLGGLNSFGAGGWADTPLAAVLPVAIRAGDGQVPGPLALRPAPGAAGHFIFAGEGSAPMNFDALPPLGGANAVGPLDPSARLLAQSADGRPLLAVRQFGTARVAAFMADTTYQWVLAPAETRGADVHRRFWRQLALWAAGRDGRPQTDFWVTTDRPHYVLTDPDSAPVAEVTVHASGTAAAAQPTLVLAGPDGRSAPVALGRSEGDDRRALLTLSTPGPVHADGHGRRPPGPDGVPRERAGLRVGPCPGRCRRHAAPGPGRRRHVPPHRRPAGPHGRSLADPGAPVRADRAAPAPGGGAGALGRSHTSLDGRVDPAAEVGPVIARCAPPRWAAKL